MTVSSPPTSPDPLGLPAWQALWLQLGVGSGDAALHAGLHAQLLACWREPHRRYHTQQHLREVLALAEQTRARAQRPAEIALALWFHDAYYDVLRDDNEARSAQWAAQAIVRAGGGPEIAARVHALIMATRGHAPSDDPDTQLLIDLDLSILGAPAARFDESDAQIRAEHAHRNEADFRLGRTRVLRGFLNRPRLYGTDGFHRSHEQQARANLRRALQRWAP